MRLPIGFDDFREIIEKKLDFVDKSLFIKETLDDIGTKVAVITRPRRFGKTLNLSMLRYFLAAEIDGKPTKGLFDNLKIAKAGDHYLEYQGKYPVIFLSFKDIKEPNFAYAYDKFQLLLSNIFDEFTRVIEASSKLTANEKELFELIVRRKVSRAQLEESLKFLSVVLAKHYGEKVFILLDEYDTPIQASYVNGYYDEMISFTRGLLGAALKTNSSLEKAIVTGVIRVAKESLFSGLNNVKIYSVLQNGYSEHFGFTEAEVAELLQKAAMLEQLPEIKQWYNGYLFGNTVVYNPWSIVNCISENQIRPYWVNTSDSVLIRDLIVRSSVELKEQFEKLLAGEVIENLVDEHVVFGDLKNNPGALWSLLVTAGYLKVLKCNFGRQGFLCQLQIPNEEIHIVYINMLERWLSEGRDLQWYNNFLNDLLTGNIKSFAKRLEHIMEQVVSVHDVAKEPEAFYHGLMLGFTASLSKDQYEIRSNRESGDGRYDIMLIPKDLTKLGIILELKSEETSEKSHLQQAAQNALVQIDAKNYAAELKQRGFTQILKVGIAFCGKEFVVVSQN